MKNTTEVNPNSHKKTAYTHHASATNPQTLMYEDFDLNAACSAFDLAEYVLQTFPYKSMKRRGDEIRLGPCPICKTAKADRGHGGGICFSMNIDKGVFKCHSTRSGQAGGSVFNYLILAENLSPADAAHKFKYGILKRDEAEDKRKYAEHMAQERIKEQQETEQTTTSPPLDLTRYRFEKKDKDGNGTGKYMISPTHLAEYFTERERFIFVRDNAIDTVQQYFYANGYYNLVSDDELRAHIKSYIPLELQATHTINEVYKLLRTTTEYTDRDELDADESIINFDNGILDVDTGEMLSHSSDYLSTVRIPIAYDPAAPVPEKDFFTPYFDHLTAKDKGKQDLILQFLGMAVSNVKGYRPKKGLFMVGAGDTGKSVIRNLAGYLVGKHNNSNVTLEMLEARFGTATIYRKRLIGSADMSFMTVKELFTFKKLYSRWQKWE